MFGKHRNLPCGLLGQTWWPRYRSPLPGGEEDEVWLCSSLSSAAFCDRASGMIVYRVSYLAASVAFGYWEEN